LIDAYKSLISQNLAALVNEIITRKRRRKDSREEDE